MSSATAYNALHDFLEVAWDAGPAPLVYENEKFDKPEPPAPWIYVEVIGTLFDAASIGAGDDESNLYREDGQVFFHVFVPKGSGSVTARGLGEQLATLFRGRELLGGKMIFPSASIGDNAVGSDDGNWWRMTAAIAFQRED
ncbi:MAG TPA: phage tail terminator-like protein [Alphaproteobacteria bacterium]|jgi:hypothetical protein